MTATQVSLLKFTSMTDVATTLATLYRGHDIHLWTTHVAYRDDPVTQSIFRRRIQDHGPVTVLGNDPHTLQGLTNIDLCSTATLVVDGINFLTSNLMLRSNSDEDETERTTTLMLKDELQALIPIADAPFRSIILISADMQADPELHTFQGRTYQRLLNIANQTVVDLMPWIRVYTVLSGGIYEETP